MQNVISIREIFNLDAPSLPLVGHMVSIDDTDLFKVSDADAYHVTTYVGVLEFLKAHDAFDGVTLALDTVRERGITLNDFKAMIVASAWGARPELTTVVAAHEDYPFLFEVIVLDDDGMPYDSEISTDSMFDILMTWSVNDNLPEGWDFVEELESLW